MELDPSLSGVSHLILDEIHERDIMSDFIISLMKKVVTKRKDLKLILMSATLNSDKFSKYYNDCPMLEIPGFTYHVEEYYLEDAIKHTNFKFETPFEPGGGRKRMIKPRFRQSYWKQHGEYFKQFGPFIRQLKDEGNYPFDVIKQLENTTCEDMNYDLIFNLIMYICNKVST